VAEPFVSSLDTKGKGQSYLFGLHSRQEKLMGGGMSILGILMIFGGGMFPNILNTPPRDLAALVRPKIALERMGVTVEEAELIALLKTPKEPKVDIKALEKVAANLGAEDYKARKAAAEQLQSAGHAAIPMLKKALANDDPEVSMTARKILAELEKQKQQKTEGDGYAKRLFAIRALEGMKSQNALLTLGEIAKGADVTLALAASDAIEIIQGRKMPPRPVKKALSDLAALVPQETGFVVVVDLGSKPDSRSLMAILEEAAKAPQAKAIVNAGMPMMAPGQIIEPAEKQIVSTLGQLGNIRVDAVAVALDRNLGVDANSGAIAIVRGRWDRKRIEAVLKATSGGGVVQNGKTIYVLPGMPAMCFLDDDTFVIALADDASTSLSAYLNAPAKPGVLPKELKPAFEMVGNGDVALAASGVFGKEQKELFLKESTQQLKRVRDRIKNGQANRNPMAAVEEAFCAALLKMLPTHLMTAKMTRKGALIAETHFVAAVDAKKFGADVNKVDKVFREIVAGQLNAMPDAFKKLIEGVVTKPVVRGEAKEKVTVLTVDSLSESVLGVFMPMMMGVRHRVVDRAVQVQAMPVQVEAVEIQRK
jgi:hypothetical protein